MAKTPCTHSVDTHYARFVGRVGGLAVALGIGVAIANNPAIASADDGQGAEKASTTSESTSTPSSTKDNDPVKSVVKQIHSRLNEVREKVESAREDVSSRLQTRSSQRETAESSNVQAKQVVQATQIVRTTPKPPKPAPNPALVAVAGFVRREIEHAVTPVRTAESFTPTATVAQSVATPTTSPLGTPEQRDAEQTAVRNGQHATGAVDQAGPQDRLVRHRARRVQQGRRAGQGEPRAAQQVRRRVRDGSGVPAAAAQPHDTASGHAGRAAAHLVRPDGSQARASSTTIPTRSTASCRSTRRRRT